MSVNITYWPVLLDLHELGLVLDGDDIDELREVLDQLSDQVGAVKARIHELEETRGNPELREQIRDYHRSIL